MADLCYRISACAKLCTIFIVSYVMANSERSMEDVSLHDNSSFIKCIDHDFTAHGNHNTMRITIIVLSPRVADSHTHTTVRATNRDHHPWWLHTHAHACTHSKYLNNRYLNCLCGTRNGREMRNTCVGMTKVSWNRQQIAKCNMTRSLRFQCVHIETSLRRTRTQHVHI
jgi:hypothetical protein